MRVMEVDGNNQLLRPLAIGRYQLNPVLGRFTGAVTTGALFAMRNGTSRTVLFHKLALRLGFTGTSEDTIQILNWRRFNTATHSGGTAITVSTGVIPKKSVSGADQVLSGILDIRYADITGTSPLTATSVVYETAFAAFPILRNDANVADCVIHFERGNELVLRPSEGLALFSLETALAGDVITGDLEWSEI